MAKVYLCKDTNMRLPAGFLKNCFSEQPCYPLLW